MTKSLLEHWAGHKTLIGDSRVTTRACTCMAKGSGIPGYTLPEVETRSWTASDVDAPILDFVERAAREDS